MKLQFPAGKSFTQNCCPRMYINKLCLAPWVKLISNLHGKRPRCCDLTLESFIAREQGTHFIISVTELMGICLLGYVIIIIAVPAACAELALLWGSAGAHGAGGGPWGMAWGAWDTASRAGARS